MTSEAAAAFARYLVACRAKTDRRELDRMWREMVKAIEDGWRKEAGQ